MCYHLRSTTQTVAIVCYSCNESGFIFCCDRATVPVLLGLTAAAEWIISYRQLDGRLPAINHALGELIQLLLWWDGLSILQQRMPYYKEQLVTSTEEIIVKEVETFTKVALSNVGKDLSKEGTDENDEGGGGKKNNKKDR